jgi:hypothetical protein|tara:strand:+ start:256 stop:522 length:267 start_codon:yes stop_codon:yes gene_type:complete
MMPKAKISREAWVNWRFSAQHEVEDLDYSYDIIESFKENGTFKLELDLDDFFGDCGYLDTSMIENLDEFPDLEEDQEIDPCSVEVEWI